MMVSEAILAMPITWRTALVLQVITDSNYNIDTEIVTKKLWGVLDRHDALRSYNELKKLGLVTQSGRGHGYHFNTSEWEASDASKCSNSVNVPLAYKERRWIARNIEIIRRKLERKPEHYKKIIRKKKVKKLTNKEIIKLENKKAKEMKKRKKQEFLDFQKNDLRELCDYLFKQNQMDKTKTDTHNCIFSEGAEKLICVDLGVGSRRYTIIIFFKGILSFLLFKARTPYSQTGVNEKEQTKTIEAKSKEVLSCFQDFSPEFFFRELNPVTDTLETLRQDPACYSTPKTLRVLNATKKDFNLNRIKLAQIKILKSIPEPVALFYILSALDAVPSTIRPSGVSSYTLKVLDGFFAASRAVPETGRTIPYGFVVPLSEAKENNVPEHLWNQTNVLILDTLTAAQGVTLIPPLGHREYALDFASMDGGLPSNYVSTRLSHIKNFRKHYTIMLALFIQNMYQINTTKKLTGGFMRISGQQAQAVRVLHESLRDDVSTITTCGVKDIPDDTYVFPTQILIDAMDISTNMVSNLLAKMQDRGFISRVYLNGRIPLVKVNYKSEAVQSLGVSEDEL